MWCRMLRPDHAPAWIELRPVKRGRSRRAYVMHVGWALGRNRDPPPVARRRPQEGRHCRMRNRAGLKCRVVLFGKIFRGLA